MNKMFLKLVKHLNPDTYDTLWDLKPGPRPREEPLLLRLEVRILKKILETTIHYDLNIKL